MITRGIGAFMARDWQDAPTPRIRTGLRAFGDSGPSKGYGGLRFADELRPQALLQHPDRPDAASRRDGLRHYVRTTELFARVDAARRD